MQNFMKTFKQIPVTMGLVTVMTGMYVAAVIASKSLYIDVYTLYRFGGLLNFSVTQQGEWWRLITMAFVHASFIQLILNVVIVYFLGRIIEVTLGRFQLIAIFLLGVLSGSLFVLLFGNQHTLFVGATSFVFALIGVMVYLGINEIERGAWAQEMKTMLVFVAMNIIFMFFGSTISIWEQVGGFFMGMIVPGMLMQSDNAKRTFKTSTTKMIISVALTVILLAVLIIGIVKPFGFLYSVII